MSDKIKICDVVLRDGIQKEPQFIETKDKLSVFEALCDAGVKSLEVTSFVNNKVIPQMSDAEEMIKHTKTKSDVNTHALIINDKGFKRALDAGTKAIALVATCSETFSEKNNRMSVSESRKVILDIMSQAKAKNIWVRLYMTTAWVCPYEGSINTNVVTKELESLLPADPDEVVLADTIGHASPNKIKELLTSVTPMIANDKLFLHLHDTKAFGLANVLAALECNVRGFDSALGGIGGCPFAPGAAGNLATEDLVFFLEEMGLKTGVNLDLLWQGVKKFEKILNRPLGGRTRDFHNSTHKCQ